MTEHQAQILLLFTGLVALAMLIAAIAIGIIAVAVSKLIKQLTELTAEAKGKVYPLLATVHSIATKGDAIALSAHGILEDTRPKIERVATNIADTSDVYRAKVAQVDHLITDTTVKAQRQSDRVDDIVTDALTRVSHVAESVQKGITAPARQFSGILSGARAGIESLVQQYSRSTSGVPRRDGDRTPSARNHNTPKPVAFEGENIYTGLEDDYHA